MVTDKAVRVAIYTKLNVAAVTTLLGSGSASIVHGVAPPTATFPLCLIGKHTGRTDDLAMGGSHTSNHLWLVKGIARAKSASAAEDIDKAAFDLLHFGALAITGAESMYLARESDINYPELDGDVVFWHVGGLYRLKVQNS